MQPSALIEMEMTRGQAEALAKRIHGCIYQGRTLRAWVPLMDLVAALGAWCTYFFDPLPIRTSGAVHRFLSSLQIKLRPQELTGGTQGS